MEIEVSTDLLARGIDIPDLTNAGHRELRHVSRKLCLFEVVQFDFSRRKMMR